MKPLGIFSPAILFGLLGISILWGVILSFSLSEEISPSLASEVFMWVGVACLAIMLGLITLGTLRKKKE